MDAWGVDEVIRFLKEEIKGLTPADVDRLIDKVWWRQDVADGVVCFCLSHALFFFFFFLFPKKLVLTRCILILIVGQRQQR